MKQKGFSLVILLSIVAVLALIGTGGFLLFPEKKILSPDQTKQIPNPETQPELKSEPTPIVVQTTTPSFAPTPKPKQNPLPPTPIPTPIPTPSQLPILGVPKTSASAITSPPPSMEGINTHSEYDGTGADPNIITLGPKVGGHPGWASYEHKPGMSFEAYKAGSPVLAPFDMVLVGFRDTSTQVVSGGISAHSDDIKLFFKSASPDWPGAYMTVYHLLTSPLLTGHTQRASNDLMAAPAQGFQIFWDGTSTVLPTGNASSYGALIGYKVKRGELIGFAGSVPTLKGIDHNFADFYFFVPDTSVNPNIKNGNKYLHLVQPGSFFYWKSYSPDADFPSGVLAYPFEIDGYQLPAEQRDVNFKYTLKE